MITLDGDVTTWTTEFEAERLEKAIRHKHYWKASVTQFGHGPMQALLGFNGLTTQQQTKSGRNII